MGSGINYIAWYAFYYCEWLTSINYNGTIEEWNNISKDSSWRYDSSIMYIVCSDGTITL